MDKMCRSVLQEAVIFCCTAAAQGGCVVALTSCIEMKGLSRNFSSVSLVPALSKWRDDITGLRALAVIPVVIYHAFPQLIPGGFFGVDIFFVISGYLISNIIFRELELGSFSWKSFYAKRVRRIVPNVLLVLAFVSLLGYFFMLNGELRQLGRAIYSGAFFYENLHLLGEGDYFASKMQLQPLLHLWSLAIEEQFYIVFPLACVVSCLAYRVLGLEKIEWRFFGLSLLVVITIASFLYCVTSESREFAFYFPLTRFWEISSGIVLSYLSRYYSIKPFENGILSFFGFFLILVSFFGYEDTFATPGLFSLLPVVGAILIIASDKSVFVNKTVLSCKWMLFFGLISYSIYIWHWPIFVFGRLIAGEAYSWWMALLLIGVTVPVSYCVYQYVEVPIIRMKSGRAAKLSVLICFIGMLVAVAVGQALRHTRVTLPYSFENRHPEVICQPMPYYLRNFNRCKHGNEEFYCTDPNKVIEALFIGDSHSYQYAYKADELSRKYGINIGIFSSDACLMVEGAELSLECQRRQPHVSGLLRNPSLKVVILSQHWGRYAVSDKKYKVTGKPLKDGGLMDALMDHFSLVKKSGKSFYVMEDQPSGETVDWRYKISRLPYSKEEHYYWSSNDFYGWRLGNQIAASLAGDSFVKTVNVVCPNGICDSNNYHDYNHLKLSYLRDSAVWLDPIFERHFGDETQK